MRDIALVAGAAFGSFFAYIFIFAIVPSAHQSHKAHIAFMQAVAGMQSQRLTLKAKSMRERLEAMRQANE